MIVSEPPSETNLTASGIRSESTARFASFFEVTAKASLRIASNNLCESNPVLSETVIRLVSPAIQTSRTGVTVSHKTFGVTITCKGPLPVFVTSRNWLCAWRAWILEKSRSFVETFRRGWNKVALPAL